MKHRYIILVDPPGKYSTHTLATEDAALHGAGMECRFASRSVRVFTSADTPTLLLQEHGLIIGQIFNKAGQSSASLNRIDQSRDALVSDLVKNNWGEYLLLHLSEEHVPTILRDPSGGVSCVYMLKEGTGFITSDISLAVRLGRYRRQVDWQAILHGLYYPYLRTSRTGLQDVSELMPGCALHCRVDGTAMTTAWSPWEFAAPDNRHNDPRAAADDVRSAVSNVVAAMASVDQRFLVQLSGGLDSSIVTACLRDASAKATFCSLVVPVAGTDERTYARLMTDALGCELFSVHVGFDSARFDFPTPPASVVPAIGALQRANNEAWAAVGSEHHVDSIFSGSGGDTIFCYLKTAAPAADAFRERGFMAGISAIRNLAALHQCTVWKAGGLALKKMMAPPRTTWRMDETLLNPAALPVPQDPHPWMVAPPGAFPGDRERINDLIGTQLYRHARPYGTTQPMRFPLLAQPVMEACLRVPSWMWISGGRDRVIARQAFADLLPAGVLNRRSKGSYAGYLAAIYEGKKSEIRQFLEEGELCAHGILDRGALSRFLNSDLGPRNLSFLRTFDLCATENWIRGQAHMPPPPETTA